jgi:hypothetical protein
MLSKKTLFATGGILAIFLLMCASQGAMAATGLPSYISSKTTIHGYSLVYYNETTVTNLDNIKDVNVTCWTTMWYRAANTTVTSSIIGASLVNAGGRIFNKAINLTGTNASTLLVHKILNNAGLSNATIAGISNVWDLFVAVLQEETKNSSTNVTQITLAKADHALIIGVNRTYLKHILFATKGPYMLMAFDYDLNQWAVNWSDTANVSRAMFITERFQADVWFLWHQIGALLKVFNAAANWLSGSGVPATSTASAATSSGISPASNTAITDLQSFANDWAGIAGSTSSIPGFEPAIVFMAVAASGAMIVTVKVRKSKRT